MTKPFLRWAGSKRQLLPKLALFWNADAQRYVEPFMGSACLYFALEPPKGLLSDLNGELVHAFKEVRDRPEELAQRLQRLPQGERAYYRIRSLDPERLKPLNRAARFIYLNRFCFNGLYRTNQKGEFNVPYGGEKSGTLPSGSFLKEHSTLLSQSELRQEDFESAIRDSVKPGDFVYLDPPYSVSGRRVFREYGPSAFGPEDIGRLLNTLNHIDSVGAEFVLSYANSQRVKSEVREWKAYTVTVRRNISGFTSSRGELSEVIITNIDRDVDLATVAGEKR